MTRKNSGYKTGQLMRRELRRQLPLAFLSVLAMLLVLPGQLLLDIQSINQRLIGSQLDLNGALEELAEDLYLDPLTGLLLIALPILVAMTLFHYLHVPQQTAFYHAQPMRRSALFRSRFWTGILLQVPPYLVSVLLMFAICAASGYGDILSLRLFGSKLLVELGLLFVIYAVSVLSCVLTGSAVAALVLNFGIQFGLMTTWMSVQYLVRWFYPSALPVYEDWGFSVLSPIFRYLTDIIGRISFAWESDGTGLFAYDSRSIVCAVIYCAVAVVMVIASLQLYRLRRSERTGSAMAFALIRVPVKYVAMLTSAVFFGEFLHMSTGLKFTFYLGMLLGIFAAHFLIEVLFERRLGAMFAHQSSLWIFVAAATVCVVLLRLDITGYNSRLPERAAIVGANVVSSIDSLSCDIPPVQEEQEEGWNNQKLRDRATGQVLTQTENLDEIYALAQRGAESMKDYRIGILDDHEQYVIGFRLADGSTFVRTYYTSGDEQSETCKLVENRLTKVRFSEEYLTTRTAAARADAAKTASIYVTNSTQVYEGGTTLTNPETIAQLLAAVKEESAMLTEDYVIRHLPVMVLHVNGRQSRRARDEDTDTALTCGIGDYNIPIYSCEEKTVDLLQAQGISVARYDYSVIRSIYLDVTETKQEFGTMLAGAEEEYWSGTVRDADDFAYVLSGSAATDLLDSCDAVVSAHTDRNHQGFFDYVSENGEEATVSIGYLEGMVPEGLGRYRDPE